MMHFLAVDLYAIYVLCIMQNEKVPWKWYNDEG